MSMSIHHLIRMTDLALFPVFFFIPGSLFPFLSSESEPLPFQGREVGPLFKKAPSIDEKDVYSNDGRWASWAGVIGGR